MVKAKTRYIKKHYRGVKIKRELYEELRRLAESRGMTVPELIQELYKNCASTQAQPSTQG